jgi:uncharacterized protein (DUF433 family)
LEVQAIGYNEFGEQLNSRRRIMSEVANIYAHKTAEGGWRIADSRVSLDSVVCAYWEGKSPEAIAEEFPALTPEQVFGAIAFYLHNREEIDAYFAQQTDKWKELAAQSSLRDGSLLRRIRKHRAPNTKDKD